MSGTTEEASATIRVYLVEDHADFRQLLQTFISFQKDIECCGTAGSAEEALGSIPATQPDVVVTDLFLPKMTGIDLARDLKRRTPSARTLILSGHKEQHYVRQAAEAGAAGYIVKGTAREFLDAVRRCHRGEFVVSLGLD